MWKPSLYNIAKLSLLLSGFFSCPFLLFSTFLDIETPEGNGKVVGLNILDISMQIKVEGLEQPLEYKMEELEALN